MKRLFILLIVVLTITSCTFKVVNNGKNYPFPKQKTEDKSILVFSQNDSVPDNAIFIGDINMYSAIFWGEATFKSPYYLMLDYEKTVAKELGANIIKVTGIKNRKIDRFRFYTKMYVLNEPYLSAYKNRIASIEQSHKDSISNLCILHFKSIIYSYGNVKVPIYLNDSLLGYSLKVRDKKGKHIYHTLDFTFDHGGILSSLKGLKGDTTNVDIGNEYYFFIEDMRGRRRFNQATKYKYENFESE